MPSQESAERFAPRGTIFGRPRRSSGKPARRTSTTTRLPPVFVNRMGAAPGAVPEIPSGRSAGVKADRWMVSAYPVSLLLTTVTCSDTEAGVSPAAALPKLTVDRSSAIESTGWMSMSTAALWETPSGGGGGPEPHEAAGVDELCGAGDAEEKSLELSSVSVHPAPARTAASVLLIA